MNILEVKDLCYRYDQNEPKMALDHVSFTVEKGTYTCVIGHNGSGKSTLAKLIAGLMLKESGSIVIDGIEQTEESIEKIRPKIGIVFQNPDNQFIGSTVKDDIVFGLENMQVESEKMDDIILKYAKEVNMLEFLDKEPSNMSGGQKQRVAIAGILAMNPELIILDEATSMLDPQGKKEIKDLVFRLHEESNKTIISITHDIEEALHADRVIVLSEGKIILNNTPYKVFDHDQQLRKIDLDIPFTIFVKKEFEKAGIKLHDHLEIDELVEEICQSK
jgi:energy-coupling factor transport system ATP-binding protein